MLNETRVVWDRFTARQNELNGVPVGTESFAVTNPIEQTMEAKIQESHEFLKRINVSPVIELAGEKLGLSMASTIASTQDTNVGDRQTQDPTTLDGFGYLCTKTNFDVHMTYQKLDLWAGYPEFQNMWRDMVMRRIALDRIMIGFNGTSRAATSDRATNPLLQDVNIGWSEKIRVNAPANHVTEIVPASGAINIGATGDFKNLDSFIYDTVNSMIPSHLQEDPDLIVLMGRKLLADKYFPLIETHGETPTENKALDYMISAKRVGGLPAVRAPFIPDGTLLITRLDNLSIYWQKGSRRRTLVDNAKRDRVEDYQSINEAYVVEDYDGIVLAENIQFV